jgi:isocitrate dehydrogenase
LPYTTELSEREQPSKKNLVGVDVFLQWRSGTPKELGDALKALSVDGLELQLITNRGVKVYPEGFSETFCVDHWRCRFVADEIPLNFGKVLALQTRLYEANFDVVKTENLYDFDNEPGYAAVHG